ncbi:hypothetical protein BCV70DRAFT_197664 [Testicularia cyperi]|uniref:Uncharacterized protein n=1 Tax=Testicularia cyperi TaxID=1882483 RepID=A0A317Y065_9BASI|nr:hypothetical protein BCV70DRAFT_197664 [Testicularia cyperi]
MKYKLLLSLLAMALLAHAIVAYPVSTVRASKDKVNDTQPATELQRRLVPNNEIMLFRDWGKQFYQTRVYNEYLRILDNDRYQNIEEHDLRHVFSTFMRGYKDARDNVDPGPVRSELIELVDRFNVDALKPRLTRYVSTEREALRRHGRDLEEAKNRVRRRLPSLQLMQAYEPASGWTVDDYDRLYNLAIQVLDQIR